MPRADGRLESRSFLLIRQATAGSKPVEANAPTLQMNGSTAIEPLRFAPVLDLVESGKRAG
jgi:hypothetical protein